MSSFYAATFPNIIASSKQYLKILTETTETASGLIDKYNNNTQDINIFYGKTYDDYDQKKKDIKHAYVCIDNSITNFDKCLKIIENILSLLKTTTEQDTFQDTNLKDTNLKDSNLKDTNIVYTQSVSLLTKLNADYKETKNEYIPQIRRQIYRKIYRRAKNNILRTITNLEKSREKIDEFGIIIDKIISIVNSKKINTKLSKLSKQQLRYEDEQSIKDLEFPNSGGRKTTRKKRQHNRRSRKFRGGYSLNSIANFPIAYDSGTNMVPELKVSMFA